MHPKQQPESFRKTALLLNCGNRPISYSTKESGSSDIVIPFYTRGSIRRSQGFYQCCTHSKILLNVMKYRSIHILFILPLSNTLLSAVVVKFYYFQVTICTTVKNATSMLAYFLALCRIFISSISEIFSLSVGCDLPYLLSSLTQ